MPDTGVNVQFWFDPLLHEYWISWVPDDVDEYGSSRQLPLAWLTAVVVNVTAASAGCAETTVDSPAAARIIAAPAATRDHGLALSLRITCSSCWGVGRRPAGAPTGQAPANRAQTHGVGAAPPRV
ncbi:hypothetical protein Raf01_61930 [Rugosimonospora africana]|uniref:Uncharacterized protein n=1 Tax=Rugosimonospora africana TaxID=556532 RepID=A0A8J3R0K6_9ACTN|nr:hypothetical protein Raf01_61930 [Rugosimonospora africana]